MYTYVYAYICIYLSISIYIIHGAHQHVHFARVAGLTRYIDTYE